MVLHVIIQELHISIFRKENKKCTNGVRILVLDICAASGDTLQRQHSFQMARV